jgi:small-conductance mechanosensitive channel/CRP-like cAMP-binding protein
MSLWHDLENTSGLHSGLGWLIVIFCAAAAAVMLALPTDRTRVRAAIVLFIIGILGLLLATVLPPNIYYTCTCIIALLAMSVAVVTMTGVLIFDVLLSALNAKPPEILCDLILAAAYVAAALILLGHIGSANALAAVFTTGTIITAAVGFALQDTLANVIGGVTLQLERTIGVGDWIKVNELVGEVKAIRWRQTSIETRNWDTVVIPNNTLMKSNVIVLGRRAGSPRQHRQYVYFNVDYRYPPTTVIATVNEAISAGPLDNVASEPAAHCLLLDFKDSYGSYAVRYWLTDLNPDEITDSLVRCRIVFALKRQGISVAIPAYRTFQTEEGAQKSERIVAENMARRIRALSHVDLFAPLTDDEKTFLGHRLLDSPFATGEVMARQGDESPCMYLIVKGRAEVRLALEGGSPSSALAELGEGQFFGEMGLMTGDPRSASVTAISDVTCLRLDKDDFREVLRRRPEIAEAISQILATRRGELELVRDRLHGEAMKDRSKSAQNDLLQRIRKFFHL